MRVRSGQHFARRVACCRGRCSARASRLQDLAVKVGRRARELNAPRSSGRHSPFGGGMFCTRQR
eukprot:2022060-Lingulodinium_polyedra.AAC.1